MLRPKFEFKAKSVKKPGIHMKDLSLQDDNLEQKIKKIDIESHARNYDNKNYNEKKVQIKIMPTEVKKNFNKSDLKKPPIKGEVKISF